MHSLQPKGKIFIMLHKMATGMAKKPAQKSEQPRLNKRAFWSLFKDLRRYNWITRIKFTTQIGTARTAEVINASLQAIRKT
jgi:hypothetical protein